MSKEKVEVKLPESAIDFLDYCRTIKELSNGTVDAYERDLRIFIYFLKSQKPKNDRHNINDRFIKTIKLKHLHKFMSYLKEDRENTANARARKVATLKAYFKYLYKKAKLIKENIAEELESPKIHRVQPSVLNVEESIELLKSIDKDSTNYERDYCILTLFLSCGMRLSELNNIRLQDIKDDILTIVGKGEKERRIYLNKPSLNAISQYLNVRDDSKCSLEDKNFLFLSIQNKKIDKSTIQSLVIKHLNNANFDTNKLHTHSMRASFATMNYKNGADIATLASAMGHCNINTTKLYLNIDENDLRRLANENPLTCI